MKVSQIDTELQQYDEAFRAFAEGYQLPGELFVRPDHFAIKCADELDYLETCQAFAEDVDEGGIWELQSNGRLLASARLSGRVALGGYEFSWIEIMQPRPGSETERGFVEHTEFFFPDFFRAEEILKQKGIEYEPQDNPGHDWLNIVIDGAGREIKLNNKALADVVVWEREEGLLRQVSRGRSERS